MKNFFVVLLILFGPVTVLVIATLPTFRQSSSTDREECIHCMRQIGIALHEHYDHFQAFPSGTRANENLPPELRLSWIVSLLPFLDEALTFQKLDLRAGWDADRNDSAVRDYVLAVLACRTSDRPLYQGQGRVYPTPFVGIAGVGLDSPELPLDHPRAGFFGYDRVLRFKDIKDGLSNTMCVMGTLSENGPWTAGGSATVRGLDPTRQPYLGKGRQFGGLHSGWTMMLLADGTVRTVEDSIDARTLVPHLSNSIA